MSEYGVPPGDLDASESRLQMLQAIVEGAPAAIVLLDLEGTVRFWNAAAERMFGWTREEAVGRPIPTLPEEKRQEALEWLVGVARSGAPMANRHTQRRTKDGRRLDVIVSGGPWKDAEGRVIGVVGYYADAMELKRVEQALSETEARYRSVVEQIPAITYTAGLDDTSTTQYVSPQVEAVLGYSLAEWAANPGLWVETLHPEDRERVLSELARARARNERFSCEYRSVARDGRVVWFRDECVEVRDAAGKPLFVQGVMLDISQQKAMEAQLLRAQRLETVGRMAGQVAHDFNNLLSPLMAYPELIRMQLPEGHPVAAYCDVMVEAAERMAGINENMMALGRRGLPDEQRVDLNQVVRQAVGVMGDYPRSLTVETSLSREQLIVSGSPALLSRAVLNLVANGREAMEDRGLLSIATEAVYLDCSLGRHSRVEAGEYARLAVADTGSGIPAETREKVFDAFFTTKIGGNRKGSGLGLSIVQAIVEDHRGYVDLESEEGKGTTITMYIPLARQQQVEQAPRPGLKGGDETILVVDDDQLQRDLACQMLRTLGYRAEAAGSGEEALAYLGSRGVDLLILDMIMPGGMDGAETYRRVLEMRPGQRAIIVSGFSKSERVEQARALGAGAYLRKPVNMERLARAVRKELDRPV